MSIKQNMSWLDMACNGCLGAHYYNTCHTIIFNVSTTGYLQLKNAQISNDIRNCKLKIYKDNNETTWSQIKFTLH